MKYARGIKEKLDLDMDMTKEGATLSNGEGSKFLDKKEHTFKSMHMCKLRTKHSSTYVGGANTTNSGLWYLSKIIYTW